MQIKVFTIEVMDPSDQIESMNKFLRSHKIIDVEKQFFTCQQSAFWSFCIRYVGGKANRNFEKKEKIDYREVLDETAFKKYCQYRDIRRRFRFLTL